MFLVVPALDPYINEPLAPGNGYYINADTEADARAIGTLLYGELLLVAEESA